MTKTADNYVAAGVLSQLRRQAFKVWAITLIAVFVWNLAIVMAPITRAEGFSALSVPLYSFFGFICHQLPARSFFIDGEPFGVCSRCFGVYFGLFLGIAAYPLWRPVDEI